MFNEQEFYQPKFFTKRLNPENSSGGSKNIPKYLYDFNEGEQSYWCRRDQGQWEGIPRIYSDDCPPFFK